jgi:hypothetical protein
MKYPRYLDHLSPELMVEVLCIAAEARTPEEQARVLWRASDYMWWQFPRYTIGMCRDFNDYLKDLKLPMVKPLFSPEEVKAYLGVDTSELPLEVSNEPTVSSEQEHYRKDLFDTGLTDT